MSKFNRMKLFYNSPRGPRRHSGVDVAPHPRHVWPSPSPSCFCLLCDPPTLPVPPLVVVFGPEPGFPLLGSLAGDPPLMVVVVPSGLCWCIVSCIVPCPGSKTSFFFFGCPEPEPAELPPLVVAAFTLVLGSDAEGAGEIATCAASPCEGCWDAEGPLLAPESDDA